MIGSSQLWLLLLLQFAIYHSLLSLLILFCSFTLKLHFADINIATFTSILFQFFWYLFAHSIYLYIISKLFWECSLNITSGCGLFYKEMCCLCLFMIDSSFIFYTVTDILGVLLWSYFMFTIGQNVVSFFSLSYFFLLILFSFLLIWKVYCILPCHWWFISILLI